MINGLSQETVVKETVYWWQPALIAVCVSFGLVLRVAIPSLSDVWNHVNFIGGNAALGMTFAGVYLLCAILGCVSCFLGTE